MVEPLQVGVKGQDLLRRSTQEHLPVTPLLVGQRGTRLVGGVIDEDEPRDVSRVFAGVEPGDRASHRMPYHDVGAAFSGGAQKGMQIRGVVLQCGRLGYRVAAARLEVLCTLTSCENSPGTVVGAYPVGFGYRGQHRLFRWVARRAPCFGAVSGPRDEHDRGRPLALALHVHLAAPADIDQAGKILVMAGATLTGVALT
jgi:hypothetical protein